MTNDRASHKHLLVIGGQRCGTTWLSEVLAKHPDVRFTSVTRPEPKFFLSNEDHDLYDSLFPRSGGPWFTDKSTSYLERADAARRAAHCVPDATVVAVLRDPVERAYSNWRFSVMNGLEDLSFEESLTDRAQRRPHSRLSTSPFESLSRGRYAEMLEPWGDYFPEGLVVLQYERMTGRDGGQYLSERFTAVGLAPAVGWPTSPPPMNAAPLTTPINDLVRNTLIDYYAGPNKALEPFGIDTALWSR